jgi:hypothetical protein
MQRLLRMSQEQWNEKVAVANYDHAWSLVQFILDGRGDGGDRALAGFLRALSSGQSAEDAFRESLGNSGAFERQWRAYWESLPKDGTPDRYAGAAAAAVTHVVARAAAAGQTFQTFDDFLAALQVAMVRCPEDDWLPQSLALRALPWAPGGSRWALEGEGGRTRVVLTTADGARKVGTFTLRDGRVREVVVREDGARER